MDSITQAALGAVCGELVLGRKLGWRASLLGLFFGTLPDLDIFASPFLDEVARLKWHRGVSHSLLVIGLATVLLAKPIAWFFRKREVRTSEAGLFVLLAWGTHVLIDVFTTYGTQIYEPFSDERVSLSNFSIVDPLFTLPLLWCLWMVFCRCVGVWQKEYESTAVASTVAHRALFVSGLYVLWSFGIQGWAKKNFKERMRADFPEAELVQVAPTFGNTILWRGLVETEEAYLTTYWSPFDKSEAKWDRIEKRRELAEVFEGEALFEGIEWFAQGEWIAREGPDGKVVLVDMRFRELRDPKSGQQYPMFQWHMGYDEDGKFVAPQYRPNNIEFKGALGMLWARLLGNLEAWEETQPF